MTTKITVIFDNPETPEVFEATYPDLIDRARKIPVVLRMETSKVWPKEDGTPTPRVPPDRLVPPRLRHGQRGRQHPRGGGVLPAGLRARHRGARALFADIEES